MIWNFADHLLTRDLLPDGVIRLGIRRLLAERLAEERRTDRRQFVEGLRESPIALSVDKANEQHYEVPTEFFELVLGRHLKYSSGFWRAGVRELDAAEAAMLALSAERADLQDGQDILELGCGWGSMTLWAAERFPRSRIVAVSNSQTQQDFIRARALDCGLDNIELRRADMNDFEIDRRFDRVISIEMFEHMRNYQDLLRRIAGWLKPEGRLFVHIFCHKDHSYPFEVRDAGDWMARYFFTGGIMPSADLLPQFNDSLRVEQQWMISGEHYARTAEAWVENMDARRERVLPILRDTYGSEQARRWWVYWRVFFLACAELFGYRDGKEWQVAHYRFVSV